MKTEGLRTGELRQAKEVRRPGWVAKVEPFTA